MAGLASFVRYRSVYRTEKRQKRFSCLANRFVLTEGTRWWWKKRGPNE
jgi:hypothetical protein